MPCSLQNISTWKLCLYTFFMMIVTIIVTFYHINNEIWDIQSET
jgi:hypothetical protein